MSTPICIVGTVATQPRVTRSGAGVAFCTFRIASNERRYDRDKGEWVDGATNWLTVNAFRHLAEHAAESFRKGERVLVTGRLRVRRWEHDEKSGTAVEVEADALGHDLRWGVSRFTRTSGSREGDSGSPAPSGAAGAPAGDGAFVPGDGAAPWGGPAGEPTAADAGASAASDAAEPAAAGVPAAA